ncbi:hypothetical protein H0H87_000706 [Tephrocybe sp. NHM501043]|nr:hypothetical protein H0H87_000706 [Tephrocybe sp. NHM501043]
MAPAPSSPLVHSTRATLDWRPTKIMNMRDLSKDDDFLSHLLVEKLGTGSVPLLVHKMDPTRRLPKTDAHELLAIVRRVSSFLSIGVFSLPNPTFLSHSPLFSIVQLVATKGPIQHVIRQAVDELLALTPIRYYLKSYTQKQINAFATHASRYFELYNPHGFIEIAHTSRYSHRTGKSELCILATRNLAPGTVITELKGSMANLTDEEDKELKRTDLRSSDIRRDFSVIHSKQMKKNHLFLGPARFVNHDCDHNCELFREGRYITFRTLRSIAIGEEITAHYGDGYFGRKNRHCLCETCEKRGKGGYSVENDEESRSSSDSGLDSDSESDSSSAESDDEPTLVKTSINERRTRRGVYAIVTKKDEDSDDSDDEEDSTVPLADEHDIVDGEIELVTEMDIPSDLTPLATSVGPSAHTTPSLSALITPTPERASPVSSRSLSSLSSPGERRRSSSFRSIISTRRQKAEAAAQLISPPLTEDTASIPESLTPKKRLTRSVSTQDFAAQKISKAKGKAKEDSVKSTSTSRATTAKKDDVSVKKEDIEPRALRARPQIANVTDLTKDPPPKPQVPRGPDGKPLPTCSTCSNVLPVISVDSQVVWGIAETASKTTPRKKKKAEPQECPRYAVHYLCTQRVIDSFANRCMRHAAIYGSPWPHRIHAQGITMLPTPREATPSETTSRISHKSLSVLDRKLAAAASASPRKHTLNNDNADRPTKRRKMEPVKIDISAKVVKHCKDNQQKRHSLPVDPPAAPQEKRKRGRPRLNRDASGVPIRVPPRTTSLPSTASTQPRNVNGRFEKKVRSPKADEQTVLSSRAERAIERDRAKAHGEDNTQKDGAPRKRTIDDLNLQELPSKRAYHRREPAKHLVPRPSSGFKGGQLFSNPNPYRFARQTWAGAATFDESSDDGEAPVTPEDVKTPPPTVIEVSATDDHIEQLPISASVLHRGASIFKPSPLTFAKRRWTSTSSQDGKMSPDAESHSAPIPRNNYRSASSTVRQSDIGLIYSSDEEYISGHLQVGLSGESDLSSDDEQAPRVLCHSYPKSLPASHPKAPSLPSPFVSKPNFVRAGWDSLSSESDS